MSQPAPEAGLDGLAAGGGALTPDAVEAVLADFRAWLAELPAAPADPPAPPPEPVDLATLIGQFTALRHEVNLQTKAARAQAEQAGQTLELLRATANRSSAAPADDAARPLLKALTDVYDALALAAREVQRAPAALADALEALSAVPDEPPPTRRPWWQGGGPTTDAGAETRKAAREAARAAAEQAGKALGGLTAGYELSLRRLERALEQAGAEPLACVGRPFDPELMEVVEAVPGSGRPAGEVLEEVRRGYRWRGQLFRYAQVRVARD
jgi:molecular chaperone GrpE